MFFNAKKTNFMNVNKRVWREDIIAGLIGYLTTVYIVAVNGSFLSEAGVTLSEGMTITILASFFGTLLMGIYANLPLVQIPGMGINAFFAFSIIKEAGLTFQEGLAVVLIASILFLVVTFTSLGNVLKQAISDSLKHGITAGLGCFLILIGLEQSSLITKGEDTLIALGDFTSPTVIVALLTLFIAIFLFVKNVPAHFLITMIIGTILAYMFGILDLEANQVSAQMNEIIFIPSFTAVSNLSFWLAIFPLTMILVFENMGLLHGQLQMLRKKDHFEKAYQVTALSSLMSAFLGTSPTVSSAENAAIIASKGKTRIAAFTTGFLFLLTIFIIPWISVIPSTAISPILIIVGVLMVQNVRDIPMNDMTEALPAILIIVMIPFTFSIADGMAFGFIAYALTKTAVGKYKDLSRSFIVIALLFLFIFVLKTYGF